MEADFCIKAVEEALVRYGRPKIFNTDRRGRYLIGCKDSWRENIFVERLWRSIKYEEVYLHAYKTMSEASTGISR